MEMMEIARWIAEHSLETFGLFMVGVCTVAFLSWRYKA